MAGTEKELFDLLIILLLSLVAVTRTVFTSTSGSTSPQVKKPPQENLYTRSLAGLSWLTMKVDNAPAFIDNS